ncbi:hypothetical protein B0H14DRAFT_2760221 [Mycena olivaceomarginata]|nr:hypothetical protein B0H14DRAFT_2760221 [Mycena olivaceomarginata]
MILDSDLYEKLSMFLFEHTSRIHEKLRATNMNLGKQYEEQWQIYSNATSVLHRLFKPLDVGLFKRVWFRGGLEPVQIMALKKWKTNVVNRLSDRVGSTAQQATKKALASLAPPRPELNKPTGSDDAVKLWPIQASIPIQRKSLSEFCREYQISDIIMDSLFDYGLQSANGLFYLNIRDLEDAGLKRGHIAELQRAMGEFVSEYRTESGSDLGSISYSGGKKE